MKKVWRCRAPQPARGVAAADPAVPSPQLGFQSPPGSGFSRLWQPRPGGSLGAPQTDRAPRVLDVKRTKLVHYLSR